MNPDENPIRLILEGACIERIVWVPTQRPDTGELIYLKTYAHDHLICSQEAEELEAMVNGPLARNTPDDYYDGQES